MLKEHSILFSYFYEERTYGRASSKVHTDLHRAQLGNCFIADTFGL